LPPGIGSSLAAAGWSAADIANFYQVIAQQDAQTSSAANSQSAWQIAIQASETIASEDLAGAAA
jgi:hypothetical protein